MKKIISYFIILSIAFTACKNKDAEADKLDKKTYKEQKESLLDKEKKSPKEFLVLTGEDNRNFWGKSVYRGKIKNTATQCSYKNVRIKFLYYKSDGTYVTNHEDEYEDVIKPGDTFEFKTKYKTPSGTDSVTASIMSATSVAP